MEISKSDIFFAHPLHELVNRLGVFTNNYSFLKKMITVNEKSIECNKKWRLSVRPHV